MKSNEFISEDKVKPYTFKNLDVQTAVDTLNTYCRESLAMIDAPIWRGMSNHKKPIVMIDPSTGKRKSSNTSNYYTQIMSHSPYFDGWPKRDRSLICSTGSSKARGYGYGGGLYAIFPFDGVKIAVCAKDDLWATTVSIPELKQRFRTEYAMDDFNDYLGSLGFPEDWNGMVKYAESDQLQKKIKRAISPNQVMSALFKALSPERAKFQLMTIQEFAANPPQNKECWIGGPVIAIRDDMYYAFLNAVKRAENEVK